MGVALRSETVGGGDDRRGAARRGGNASAVATQSIVGKWTDLTGLNAEGGVDAIFEIRNKLVHGGRTDSVHERTADDALRTASRFVEAGDE